MKYIITLNCTVESFNHVWNIGSLEASISSGTTQDVVIMGYTFRLVGIGGNAIVSSLTQTVIPELNN